MEERYSRTEMVIGTEAVEKLKKSHIAVFGVGGVGGYAVEALVRCGVGAVDIIDNDTVSESNINRQIIALYSTVGRPKVDVLAERIADISPDCRVVKHQTFFLPGNAEAFDFSSYDYVIDAIDTVSGKIEIVKRCTEAGTPVISSMGAGNKLDPSRFEVADIYKTSVCPLAKVMRKLCRDNGIKHLKVVYSTEEPVAAVENDGEEKKRCPGSMAFTPSAAGLLIASEVVKDLIK